MKDVAAKNKIITPINACAYKVHFEALDGVHTRTAETIEDRELLPQQMRPSANEPMIGH
jgi:hypothetical protein